MNNTIFFISNDHININIMCCHKNILFNKFIMLF